MNKSSKKLTVNALAKISLVATLYCVVTIAFSEISYGGIQARPSELLNFLAFIDPLYIPGLVLGCAISNLYSFGFIDVIVGSLATLVSTYMIYKSKNLFVASLWPLINAIVVPIELYIVANQPILFNVVTIFIGEFLVMTIVGYPLFKKLFKNKHLVDVLLINKENRTGLKKLELL